MKNYIFLLSVIFFLLPGCAAHSSDPTYRDALNSEYIRANYCAAEELLKKMSAQLNPNIPVIVTTVVNIDELTESSRLGRSISEQIGARISSAGYQVKEVKMRSNIFVKRNEGELMLSRELSEIMSNHKAQAVIVGTYSVAGSFVYVNLKMVSSFDNIVIAAHDYALPLDKNVSSLLRSVPKQ